MKMEQLFCFYDRLSQSDIIIVSTFAFGFFDFINLESLKNPYAVLLTGCLYGTNSVLIGKLVSQTIPSYARGLIPIVCGTALITRKINQYYYPKKNFERKAFLTIKSTNNPLTSSTFTVDIPWLLHIDFNN